tara:strand:+ start:588 stop:908 length:321 start_codon:yes stop_codon:yes gene_type:complete
MNLNILKFIPPLTSLNLKKIKFMYNYEKQICNQIKKSNIIKHSLLFNGILPFIPLDIYELENILNDNNFDIDNIGIIFAKYPNGNNNNIFYIIIILALNFINENNK